MGRVGRVPDGEPGWLASLVGACVLVAGGFALGLVAGVVSEEPELVVGHFAGRSEEVAWLPDAEPEFTPADEAPEPTFAPEPRVVAGEWNGDVYQTGGVEVGREEPPAVAAPPPIDEPALATPPRPSGFAVQVGAFADAQAATRVFDDLHAKGFDVYVQTAAATGDGRWRVRVGPVPSKREAQQLASRLKLEERLPTWVLAEGGR